MSEFKPITTQKELNQIVKGKMKPLRDRLTAVYQKMNKQTLDSNQLKERVQKLEQLLSLLNVSVEKSTNDEIENQTKDTLNKLEFYSSNYDKLSQELDEFENELEIARTLILKLYIADYYELPITVAHMIQGETEQEMIEDCLKFKEYIGKPQRLPNGNLKQKDHLKNYLKEMELLD